MPALIVDSEDLSSLIADRLIASGQIVSCTENGDDALQMCHQTFYDVIVADINFIGPDPEEWLKMTRDHSPFSAVILTGDLSRRQTLKRGLAAGAAEVAIKPFTNLKTLVKLIESCAITSERWRKTFL